MFLLLLAFGMHERSRVAAVPTLLLYSVERLSMRAQGPGIAGVITTLVLF